MDNNLIYIIWGISSSSGSRSAPFKCLLVRWILAIVLASHNLAWYFKYNRDSNLIGSNLVLLGDKIIFARLNNRSMILVVGITIFIFMYFLGGWCIAFNFFLLFSSWWLQISINDMLLLFSLLSVSSSICPRLSSSTANFETALISSLFNMLVGSLDNLTTAFSNGLFLIIYIIIIIILIRIVRNFCCRSQILSCIWVVVHVIIK